MKVNVILLIISSTMLVGGHLIAMVRGHAFSIEFNQCVIVTLLCAILVKITLNEKKP